MACEYTAAPSTSSTTNPTLTKKSRSPSSWSMHWRSHWVDHKGWLVERDISFYITAISPIISKPISLRFIINHNDITYSYINSVFPSPENPAVKLQLSDHVLPRIKTILPMPFLKKFKKEWVAENPLILGSDIMDCRREFRPSKLRLKV